MFNLYVTITLLLFPVIGGAMIVGGYGNNGLLNSSEGLGVWSISDPPIAVADSPMVQVESSLYLCGGITDQGESAVCYAIDTHACDTTWAEVTPLPIAMHRHSAVVFETDIWYVHDSTLYVYHTETGDIDQHSLPFSGAYHHCAVHNNTHSYVAGVGPNDDQIWVNTVALDPSNWTMVGTLTTSIHAHSCVWLENEVYILGGLNPSNAFLSDAFVFDVNTHTITTISNLKTARAHARATIIDCKPAVVGGQTSDGILTDIEVYDKTLNNWDIFWLSLERERYAFGLVQYLS